MWLVNMNCLYIGIVGKKLARVKGGIIVKNVNFLGGLPMGRGDGGGLCEIFLTDLDPGYVVGEYELSRYGWVKSWPGSKVEQL